MMMSEPGGDSAENQYSYKPSLLGGAWLLRLEPDALHWAAAGVSGRIPYADIRQIRLAFRPVTMQSYRFLAEIWSDKNPKIPIASASWKSMLEQERLDDAYSRFIRALHARIAAAGGTPRLRAGAIPLLYLPGLAIFLGICVAMIALIGRAILQGEAAATLFLLGFFVVVLWQLGMFFKRNMPRRYTLDAIPSDVLPKPAAGVKT
jgi:hypothetical protein